jgi:hypothetical protein
MVLDTDRITGDKEYKADLRHRIQTDHFFLAEMLGFKKFIPRLHQPVVDLYFPKNPHIPIEDQHAIKNRMHLDPRHTYKTAMGIVDTVQWVCAFPDEITILNETATQPLAKSLTTAQGSYFYQPKFRGPTPLQLCFPELVVTTLPDGEYTSPTRTRYLIETTLGYTSPRTSQSGWHPWVENPDDMCDTENSGINASATLRRSIIERHATNKNAVRIGGYINMRGTRYHPQDLYGDTLDHMDPAEWKVLIRGSLEVLSGERLLPGEFPPEDEVRLLFPEILPYSRLRTLFYENYQSYMCQQMNDPQGGKISTFDEKLYTSVLSSPEHISQMGDVFIAWRFPYEGKEGMKDYAEGAAARIYGGKVLVIDAWRGIYTPSRLAAKVVKECKRHHTGNLIIENTPGASAMEPHIRNEGFRKNLSLQIQWLEFEDDDHRRKARIKQLEPIMRAGRIAISTDCTRLRELKTQFLQFELITENGILDCVSRLAAKLPVSLLRTEIAEEEIELQRRRREDQLSAMVFGQAGREAMEAQARLANAMAWNRVNALGLPDILGGLDG